MQYRPISTPYFSSTFTHSACPFLAAAISGFIWELTSAPFLSKHSATLWRPFSQAKYSALCGQQFIELTGWSQQLIELTLVPCCVSTWFAPSRCPKSACWNRCKPKIQNVNDYRDIMKCMCVTMTDFHYFNVKITPYGHVAISWDRSMSAVLIFSASGRSSNVHRGPLNICPHSKFNEDVER